VLEGRTFNEEYWGQKVEYSNTEWQLRVFNEGSVSHSRWAYVTYHMSPGFSVTTTRRQRQETRCYGGHDDEGGVTVVPLPKKVLFLLTLYHIDANLLTTLQQKMRWRPRKCPANHYLPLPCVSDLRKCHKTQADSLRWLLDLALWLFLAGLPRRISSSTGLDWNFLGRWDGR